MPGAKVYGYFLGFPEPSIIRKILEIQFRAETFKI